MATNLNCINLKQIIKRKHLQLLTRMFMAVLEIPALSSFCPLEFTEEGKKTQAGLLHCRYFPEEMGVCHAGSTYHNGKPALFEVSQHLLCLMQAGHCPFSHGMAS